MTYSVSYLICISAFGAALIGVLLTVLERRRQLRRTPNSAAKERRPLAA